MSKTHPDNLPEPEILAALEDEIGILAEAEHNGWTQGECDDAKKRHNLLIPCRELSELEKEKDRDAVRHYPEIVAQAGYKICGIK